MAKLIAVSGTHGVGKSTRVLELAQEMKMQHPGATVGLIQELAACCPMPVNQHTTPEAQRWIFATQLAQELEMLCRYDLVISDRSAVDAIAYTHASGFFRLAEGMMGLMESHLPLYERIHFRMSGKNDFHFADGVRDGCRDFRLRVERTMLDIYARLGLGKGAPGFVLE